MIGFSSSPPNVDAAARGKFFEAKRMFTHILNRLSSLEKKTAITSFNSDAQHPVILPPTPAQVTVNSPLAANVVVAITNPEYVKSANNPLRTPVLHQVKYSTSQDMRGATPLPIGTQTHYALPLAGRNFVQVKSSYDGVNFNSPQTFEVNS